MRRSLYGKAALSLTMLAAVLLFSACANASSTPAASGGTPAGAGGGVAVSAKLVPGAGKVLVTSDGMTLYYLKTESNGAIKCTDTCATAWPPLLLPSGTDSATAGGGVTGELGTVARPDGGMQVTYNGMPLYTFATDTPGVASGQGVENFYAVDVNNAGGGSGGPTPTASKSSGSHYGY
ncbi:MAG: hypothetical protein ABI828_07075 [Actinomycetota bacterium]